MRAAEAACEQRGISEWELMQRAGQGAAHWVRRVAAGRPVTVLCGPGNNGGDGYVIARSLAAAGDTVQIVAPLPVKAATAQKASSACTVPVVSVEEAKGEVLVDCLFGTGLSRPPEGTARQTHEALAASHAVRIAVDLPSGVDADTGAVLNNALPEFQLTLALGAWKRAHWLMPAGARMGLKRLVPIGVEPDKTAAVLIERPRIQPPGIDAHKYSRGYALVVAGRMAGAAVLAANAAQRGGAGYVRLHGLAPHPAATADLVLDDAALAPLLEDERLNAVLIGPGMGRHDEARETLGAVLATDIPTVLDADALHLVDPKMVANRSAPLVVTPHDGERHALLAAAGVSSDLGKPESALGLARAYRATVVAKGPDTVVASPQGQIAFTRPASRWLSVAGTGDVLAGLLASRLSTHGDGWQAACEAVWLHGEAARRCVPPFTASDLITELPAAMRAATVKA